MKARIPQFNSSNGQGGATLLITMVILVAVTILSLSSLKSGLLNLLMAGAHEEKMIAFQHAQAVIDGITSDGGNFPVVGGVGSSNCTSNLAGEGCDQASLSFPPGADSSKQFAKIERLAPLQAVAPRAFATSVDFKVAHFSLDSRFDNVANRGGAVNLFQGYMVLVPPIGDQSVITDADYDS